MKINLGCEHAKHDNRMRVMCLKTGMPCAFQFYKRCKGWWALTDGASGCLARKDKK